MQHVMILGILLFTFFLFSSVNIFVLAQFPGDELVLDSGIFRIGSEAVPNTNSTVLSGVQFDSENKSELVAVNNSPTNQTIKNNDSAVVLWTNRPNYVVGQEVQIWAKIFDEQQPDKAQLNIEVTNGELLYNVSLLAPKNRSVAITGLNTQSEGIYKINATAIINGNQETAQTNIRIDSMFRTLPAFFIYLTIGFFIGLAVVVLRGSNLFRSELLRFICITGIVFSILFALLLTDLQIGSFSPVGLVERSIHNPGTNSTREWVLNIGGIQEDNFVEGIQIPIYIIIFGLIGGYLRYLYKTAKLRSRYRALREMYLFCWEKVPGIDSKRLKTFLIDKFDIGWFATGDEFKKVDETTLKIENGFHAVSITLSGETADMAIDSDKIIYRFIVKKENSHTNLYQTMSWRSWLFYQSLEDLSLLFLAPLLAIALWFLLTQASTTSKYILALASFSVGLVTDEIIQALLNFIRPKISEDKGDKSNENNPVGTATPTVSNSSREDKIE